MSRTLYGFYGLCDTMTEPDWFFSIKPYDPKYWPTYAAMKRRVSLKNDFAWKELHHLQVILRKADIWTDFPAKGFTLVDAEFKGGSQDQRIDLLYMRTDGALLPSELKIGGQNKDAHGQLIRYLADLHGQKIDLAWVQNANNHFVGRIGDEVAADLHAKKFEEFVSVHNIEDPRVRILPRTGLLMDESFTPQLLTAVRYLNGYCGLAIRLLEIEAFVEDSWTKGSSDFKFRLDFVDVQ